MNNLNVLPLAITMMAGPQIMSAVIFATAQKAVRISLGFLAGVLMATSAGVAVMLGVATGLGGAVDLGSAGNKSSVGRVIQYVLVALLILVALRNWRKRETVEPPKWLYALMSADIRKAFRAGLLVILVMPSDLMVMLTVGIHVEQARDSYTDALPFIALTVAVGAIPLLLRVLLGRRAASAMPSLRDWMNNNSWLINIIACLIFVVLILA
ncbi:GAP family protein [Streptomyces sp. 3N207]|uniref:GAP family protein n=1 Tax=Streptomyces sp. 3N207 TaxID=3457417 RepID=UPI003FD54522